MTLIERITQAGLDVGGKLKADKRNNEQKYDYVSADKILSICGQALFSAGVAVLPSVTGKEVNLFEYTDSYGKAKKRYDYDIVFIMTVTDGETSLELPWAGAGSDYSVPDKALYKAITSGHKYFLMKLLCIGEGNEDGEHEQETKQEPRKKQAPAPSEQAIRNAAAIIVDMKPETAAALHNAVERKASASMTLETALEVTNSDGELLAKLETKTLAGMANSLTKGLKEGKYENAEDRQMELDAIALILASRR